MIKIDPKTGLPELPAWHFWHVGRRDSSGDYRFTLRVGYTRLFSVELFHLWIYDDLTETAIQGKAEYMYRQWSSVAEKRERDKRLIGSYPPKSLNNQGEA